MSAKCCHWGILGAATIARKNWQAIRDAGNARLLAVASRNRGRGQALVEMGQSAAPFPTPPEVVSYEALVEDPRIDAIYVPLPTGIRGEWVLRAAALGKHVLCEKPCATSTTELRSMVAACEAAGTQFMDGVMFMHGDRLGLLTRASQDPQIVGRLRRIYSQFCFAGDAAFQQHNIRMDARLEPFGCLGDLGWYNIRLTQCLLDFAVPTRVRGRILSAAHGEGSAMDVPTEFVGELEFTAGVTAGFYCSFLTGMQQWGEISGDVGRISISDFVLPYQGITQSFSVHKDEFVLRDCEFSMEPQRRDFEAHQPSNNAVNSPESRMFRHFSQNVLEKSIEPHWGTWAIATQRILDALMASARSDGAPLPLDRA